MRIISRQDAESSLGMRDAIEIVGSAFVELSNKTASVPPRIHLFQEKRRATTLVMPAFLSEENALACKIVSVFPENEKTDLPLIHALVILLDAENGKTLAVLEGTGLTALRTGAASGLATDLLARKDAKTLAIFGAGAQSRTQIEAVCAVRDIERILIFSPRAEKTNNFAAEMRKKFPGIEFEAADSPQKAVSQAEIICTATTSEKPVFDGKDLQTGTHINAVGSYKPDMREIDFETLKRSEKIVVDSRENALAEAGELVQAIRKKVINITDIYAEIGEIASGAKTGREKKSEITFFKSVGNAAQDAAIAAAIYLLSIEQNFGLEVDL